MSRFFSEFSSQAKGHIKKLDATTKRRIRDKIDKLEENPFPQEVERVEGYRGEKPFRVRVGNQRILYIVRHSPNKLIIIKIDKRDRVYD